MTASATSKRPKERAILNGILPLDRAGIPVEMIAGATLAALAIPEVMGYTKIAGMPVITGLYTIILPVIAFAILGSSRHLVVGADSATAAILATGLLATGAVAESPQYVALAGLAALMCAVALILARLLRLGFIANFLSRSVLIGFLTGVGIQVAMGQLAGVLGVSAGTGTTLEKFANTLRAIPDTSIPTLAVSLGVLATILGLGKVNKKIPGALIAVVGSIIISYVFDLSAHGVTVLGTVPSGLPPLGLPQGVITTDNILTLLPTVVSLFIVILAQSAATSRAYAVKYSDSFDENRDLIGLGVANAAAGFSGTFVVNGSPTKTEMVDSAGGRNQIAQLTAAAIVIVVLLFLTVPLAYMPNAVLAAVVLLIGLRLIDYLGMSDIYRVRKGEFFVALLTAATVVVVGVEQGIILAIVLSIIEHIRHSYSPYDILLSQSPTGRIQATPVGSGAQASPGLVMYRFGSGIYYANATRFTAEILDIVEDADPPLKWFCLVASGIGDIDYSGSDAVRQVVDELGRKSIRLVIADAAPEVKVQLDAYGLTSKIGADQFYDYAEDVVEAYRRENPDTAAGSSAVVAPSTATAPPTPLVPPNSNA